jgi:hypothetical protein
VLVIAIHVLMRAGSVVRMARAAKEDVSMIVNPGIVLTQSVANSVAHVKKHFKSWLVASPLRHEDY